jgi:hypothetical protein
MLAARAMIGFAHGYAYLTVMVHASEIVTQKMRGIIVASLNFCLISSIMVCGGLTMGFDKDKHAFGSMQWMGIVGIIYSVMGFVFIPIFTRESPVQMIRQKKFDQAVSLMVRLRNETTETWSIKNEYNELRAMIEEDEASKSDIFTDRNVRPLMLITLLKVGSVLSFNYGVNMVRLHYTTMFVSEEVNSTVMGLMAIRIVAACGTLFTIDSLGRRFHFLISFGGSAACLILMGIVVAFTSSNISWMFELLQIPMEIFGGLGIGMISDVYASEAFSTLKKPKSILFTTVVEFGLQAAIIAITHNPTSPTLHWIILVGSGIFVLIITVTLHKELPETAKMSIRQTRNEFLKSGEIVFSGSKMPAQNITFS